MTWGLITSIEFYKFWLQIGMHRLPDNHDILKLCRHSYRVVFPKFHEGIWTEPFILSYGILRSYIEELNFDYQQAFDISGCKSEYQNNIW